MSFVAVGVVALLVFTPPIGFGGPSSPTCLSVNSASTAPCWAQRGRGGACIMGLRSRLFGKKESSSDIAEASPIAMEMAESLSSEVGIIEQADALHAANNVDELFALLSTADTSDDDIAWRVARAYHDKAEDTVGDDATRERLLREGLAIADAARQRTESGYALKWYAILLGRLGDFLPTKEKVGNSFKIKESLEGAAALLPEDSSIQTALGQWCYKVASISWVERNAAKLLFGSPPESSYEEALGFATRSSEIRRSKKAALLAGQCYAKLGQSEESKNWMRAVLELESAGEADKELDRQAEAALR